MPPKPHKSPVRSLLSPEDQERLFALMKRNECKDWQVQRVFSELRAGITREIYRIHLIKGGTLRGAEKQYNDREMLLLLQSNASLGTGVAKYYEKNRNRESSGRPRGNPNFRKRKVGAPQGLKVDKLAKKKGSKPNK